MKIASLKSLNKNFKYIIGITLASVVGGASAAFVSAAIPNSSTGVISGCYVPITGTLRVIDNQAGQSCATGEVALVWNQTGPQGPAGVQGPQGPAGPTGPGNILAAHRVVPRGSLTLTDAPLPVLVTEDFGVLEATICEADGQSAYQLRNTTSHNVIFDYSYSNPLAPGETRTVNGSVNLSAGTGSGFRLASTNIYRASTETDCIFDAQVMVNTIGQTN